MTPEALHKWLLEDGVKAELEAISKKIAALEFEGNNGYFASEVVSDENLDWPRLILAGSILARSSSRVFEECALKIATGAVLLGNNSAVRDAGAVLLEKLSNSRAVALAEARSHISPGLIARLGVSARIEAARRVVQQTVLEKFSGKWIKVNEFQAEFWQAASESETGWLSASAPTASGKTFLVKHWLVDRMLTTSARVAIYIAPTRALVSEIDSSLRGLINEYEVSELLVTESLPLKELYQKAVSGNKKAIFVFTQERLHLLANVLVGNLHVDILVVDEAHKIGDGGRGVILQAAIERLTEVNAGISAVFISPATQNPEILLADAPGNVVRKSIGSDVPTVLQNIVFCSQAPGNSRKWELRLRSDGNLLPFGVIELAHRPTTVRKKIAFISAAVGSKGGTLVYANGAAEAEEIAVLVSQALGDTRLESADLSNLAELARKGVHPDYQLANVVERGVAFHYGNMPSLLRLEIERLFRGGILKFLICTSTLIEGVNLSCRNIVIRGPRKGKGHPMEAPDFWNLAGRAGRWGDEFQGNIICIDPMNSDVWPTGVPNRTRYPIKRETDVVLSRREDLMEFISARADASALDVSSTPELEQVSAYLLASFMKNGSVTEASFSKRHDSEYIENINLELIEISKRIELPSELVQRHPGVSAVALQNLLNHFRSRGGAEHIFVPEPPESEGAYDRMCFIFETINELIYPAFTPGGLIPLHVLVVSEWLKGYPLSYIIKNRIEYHKKKGREVKVSEIIRTTMEFVEQVARFKAPKYLSAYMDVLKLHLNQVSKGYLIDDDIDIGIALEFGVSTKTLLSLMELGLSRMSSVALNNLIADDALDVEGCLKWIRDNSALIRGSGIPLLIVKEIESLSRA